MNSGTAGHCPAQIWIRPCRTSAPIAAATSVTLEAQINGVDNLLYFN